MEIPAYTCKAIIEVIYMESQSACTDEMMSFCRYRWLTYINPNYYGFSASAVILLSDFESDCERDGGSELECYPLSGRYILDRFNFNVVNPYQNIVVSIFMSKQMNCPSLQYA